MEAVEAADANPSTLYTHRAPPNAQCWVEIGDLRVPAVLADP